MQLVYSVWEGLRYIGPPMRNALIRSTWIATAMPRSSRSLKKTI